MSEIFRIDGPTMSVNIGLNRVRFPAPVKTGCRVRGGAELVALKNFPAGKLSTVRVSVEIEGQKSLALRCRDTVAVRYLATRMPGRSAER
jgi:acyl dehydratase